MRARSQPGEKRTSAAHRSYRECVSAEARSAYSDRTGRSKKVIFLMTFEFVYLVQEQNTVFVQIYLIFLYQIPRYIDLSVERRTPNAHNKKCLEPFFLSSSSSRSLLVEIFYWSCFHWTRKFLEPFEGEVSCFEKVSSPRFRHPRIE